ncbi:CDP-diacylglycerol--glycerol-3-phosphate 3-phosphatidyltransferase [Candidatus Acetothermia bacterium]|nr:CDP-diacylglycerol--glycerol-3-phosphate 3-phosphatidyltransferase [Candidatus Acetothermia bacterium]MBI3642775.1 CDP-diacylglycerol--glycerol-3-phosphate 3-phosphatidyltransferase [Candidatus Acetothermia bacterium]
MTWNLPNIITLLRMAMIPLFLFFLLSGIVPHGEIFALVVFATAAISDGVDGWIARSRKQETLFGKFADPIADKLLIMAALLAFVGLGEIWNVWVLIILAREFLVMGLRLLAISHDVVISASILGKLKTLSHICLVVVLLLNRFWEWGPVGDSVKNGFIYLAVALTLLSGFEYFYKSRSLFRTAS